MGASAFSTDYRAGQLLPQESHPSQHSCLISASPTCTVGQVLAQTHVLEAASGLVLRDAGEVWVPAMCSPGVLPQCYFNTKAAGTRDRSLRSGCKIPFCSSVPGGCKETALPCPAPPSPRDEQQIHHCLVPGRQPVATQGQAGNPPSAIHTKPSRSALCTAPRTLLLFEPTLTL